MEACTSSLSLLTHFLTDLSAYCSCNPIEAYPLDLGLLYKYKSKFNLKKKYLPDYVK